ncbi:putative B6 ABC transporter substrate-binding protein [Segnochrobactraceae bacterium EtOH-i3]
MRSRIHMLMLSAATALALAAGAATAAEIKSVAIVTPEQGTDFGWNQQGVQGAKDAAAAAGLEFIAAEGMGYGDIRPTLRELADDDAGLIIAHAGGYATEAGEIAQEMKVHMALNAKGVRKPPFISDYTLSAQDGAYLAGVLAAKTTRTGIIGIVVSSESATWNSQSSGFVQGVKATRPDAVLRYAIIGPKAYSDVAGARRVTESVIAADADVIFGQGNGSSFGMIQAIETVKPPSGNKVWFIDVIGDKSSIDKGYLLSSVVWNFEPVFSKMIADIKADNFGTQNYGLALADNSLRLLKTASIPEPVWADLMTVRQEIIDGKIKVTPEYDGLKVRQMMTSTAAN